MRGREQAYGNEVSLSGSVAESAGKLIRIDDTNPLASPWLLAVSGSIVFPNVSQPFISPVAMGIFGSGGITHSVEFDIKPDSLIAMPGMSVDVNVVWDKLFLCDGGTSPDTVSRTRTIPGIGSAIPTSAKARASVKHGLPSRPNATRTYTVVTQNGAPNHIIRLPLPPFSDSLMVYMVNAAAYAAQLTSLVFIQGGQIVTTYTGAEIATVKAAGNVIPVPGNADELQMVTVGDQNIYLTFNLNL